MATVAQINVAVAALRKLVAQDVPGWEQAFISDQLLIDVSRLVINTAESAKAKGQNESDAAFVALQGYRSTSVPFYEQGSITDDILRGIVAAVLTAVKL